MKKQSFHFTYVTDDQRELIHLWLQKPHISEWIHGSGLQNTLDDLDKSFIGKSETNYWIGSNDNQPFCFFITRSEDDAVALDVFIGEENYLEKGLAIEMFNQFIDQHFSSTHRLFIDPEVANQRAVHVYTKLGFTILNEFIAPWNPVPHYLMELKRNS
ncbi:MAG: GNAT family N-acetyltransferase [Rhabdochlamydiaceae bacterium]|nr:GNAT family N-acetyltransferase [Candidatus Amphrikana amoebophyrae]